MIVSGIRRAGTELHWIGVPSRDVLPLDVVVVVTKENKVNSYSDQLGSSLVPSWVGI